MSDLPSSIIAPSSFSPGDSLFETVMNQLPEGFQVIGRDWKYLYVNDTVALQGKKTKDELLGKTMMECYPGIEHTSLFIHMHTCMTKFESVRIENEFDYPDNSKGWFELFIHPWGGGILIFSVDITHRKKTEEKFYSAIDKLNSIVKVSLTPEKKTSELIEAIQKLQELVPKVQ